MLEDGKPLIEVVENQINFVCTGTKDTAGIIWNADLNTKRLRHVFSKKDVQERIVGFGMRPVVESTLF